MAIIYSYPTVLPTSDDLVLGTDVNKSGNPTKNFTIGSIIDLVTAGAAGLGATIKLTTPPGDASDPITPFANQPIINLSNLSGTGNVSGFASFSTAGGVDITGTIGSGFTAFTSTIITGTLQTAAQPNITSVGTLTSLSVNTSVTGTAVVTTLVAPGDDLKIASTKAIVDYIATKPATETLAEALVAGNVTGGTSVIVSAGDNITFTDTSKALFGSGQDLEVNNDGIDSFITDLSTGDLRLRSDDAVKIQASTGGNTLATFTKAAGVDLYFANAKIFEILVGGAKVTGAFEATTSGTFASLVNTGTYTAGNGVGAVGQILSSTGTGTSWVTETPLYSWQIEGDSGAVTTVADGDIIHFKGMNDGGTPLVGITTAFVPSSKELRITANGLADGDGQAGEVAFWSGTGLTSTLAGDTGMTYDATANDLTVAGIIKADTFTTTAGTATWVTTVLDGFTSITSALFIGNAAASLTPPIPPFAVGSADNVEFQGNASTANQLSFGGTIGTSGDVTTVTAPTYTSGGSQLIATTIADTVVTGKVLTNLPTPTSSGILNTDTILAAMAKLQGQITATSGLTYEGLWNATTDSPALSGTTPANGVFYIVDVAGNTSLSGITDWLVGDWAIYVSNGSATDGWQKLDMTSDITGTGSANSYAMWTGPNSVATGLISQNAGANLVTIGNSGGLLVEGSTTLGDAITDTVTVTGNVTLNENLILTKGLSIPSLADPYGASGQVLTSGGGVGVANSWTTPTTGTLTGVTAGTGITVDPSAAPSPTVNIDYLGTDNAILSATAYSGTVILGTNQIWFNDINTGSVTNTLSYGLVNQLPFDQYSLWNLSDGTNTAIIASTNTAKILGGAGITSVVSPTDKSATLSIDYVGTDNAILSAGAGTPIATDELLFNNADVASGTVQRASIASIVDLGNETLAQVLSNDNVSGANDIVMADSQKVTFGANPDLQIYHSTDSFIQTLTSGSGDFYIGSQVAGKDLKISSSNDITMETAVGGDGIKILGAGAVELYHNGSKKFETTNAGVSVTGSLLVSNGSKGNLFLGPQTGGGATNSEITSNHSLYIDYAKLTGTSGNFNIRNNTTQQFTIQGSTGRVEINEYGSGTITGTPTYNLEVNSLGHIIETNSSSGVIPAGGATGKGGTFNVVKTITSNSYTNSLFSILRPGTGAIAFRVALTSGASAAVSRTKIYEYARSFGAGAYAFNKVIDSGPNTDTAANDFSVNFGPSTNGGGTTATALSGQPVILVGSPNFTVGIHVIQASGTNVIPAGARILSMSNQGSVGASITLDVNLTGTLFSGTVINCVPDDIMVCSIGPINTTTQEISATIELGYDDNTVATILVPNP